MISFILELLFIMIVLGMVFNFGTKYNEEEILLLQKKLKHEQEVKRLLIEYNELLRKNIRVK